MIKFAEEHSCGKVYPLSIAQEVQVGDVFANSDHAFQPVLFWYCSGFAFLAGEAEEAFLVYVYELLADKNCTNPRRFVLLTDDRQAEQFLLSKGGVDRRRRALFVYGENPLVSSDRLPAGYEWRDTLEQGKAPVWACRCGNLASGKLAEKLGFFKILECSVLKKR